MKVRCIDNEYFEKSLTLNKEYEVIKEIDNCYEILSDYNVMVSYLKKRFELVEEPTEFTFQEVIARIKKGEVYEPVDKICITQNITMDHEKDIIIEILPNKSFVVPTCSLFKLQEPKRRVRIYKIEHQKNGKKYDFISSQLLDCDEFVICDTKCGKSYGRIADVNTRELTEKEIEEYKECWRA